MSPSKELFQNQYFSSSFPSTHKFSSFNMPLTSSSSPTSGISFESDGRSSSCSPNNTTTQFSSAYGHACSHCNSSFLTRELLEKHELIHISNATMCNVCNKLFANVYRLQRHKISHDQSTDLRRFKCEECGKAFKFKHHLKEHLRIHSGEKPFGCPSCGKRFSHSGTFSSHMSSKKCRSMNPNVAIKHRARRNTRTIDAVLQSPSNNNQITYNKISMTERENIKIFKSEHGDKLEQRALDLSLKTTNNYSHSNSDDIGESYKEMDIDKDVESNNRVNSMHYPSLFSYKNPLQVTQEMSPLLWNILLQFSFNNYNNYLKQLKHNHNRDLPTADFFHGIKEFN